MQRLNEIGAFKEQHPEYVSLDDVESVQQFDYLTKMGFKLHLIYEMFYRP